MLETPRTHLLADTRLTILSLRFFTQELARVASSAHGMRTQAGTRDAGPQPGSQHPLAPSL